MHPHKMESHVIELPTLPKELQEDSSSIELWAKSINAEEREESNTKNMAAMPSPLLPCKLYIIPETYRLHCYYNTCRRKFKGFQVIL